MKYGRERIVGFFAGLSLAAMGVPAALFEVGNNPQWEQDIPMVQIWSNGISCSGTKIPPYHVLTAAYCYNGSNGGVVTTSNSGMRIRDSNPAKLYHNSGNIASWSLCPDGRDLALITMKTPLPGAMASVILRESLPDSGVTGQGVSLCGQYLVGNSRNPIDGGKYNASCSITDGRATLNSTYISARWSSGSILIYYGDPGSGVFLNGSLIGVISKGIGVVWEEAWHNGKLVEVAREQYSL